MGRDTRVLRKPETVDAIRPPVDDLDVINAATRELLHRLAIDTDRDNHPLGTRNPRPLGSRVSCAPREDDGGHTDRLLERGYLDRGGGASGEGALTDPKTS